MGEADTVVWKCAECKQSDDVGGTNNKTTAVTSVCVHCGKPLCKYHEYEIVDDAFAEVPDAPTEDDAAVHCKDCRDGFHPGVPTLRDWQAR